MRIHVVHAHPVETSFNRSLFNAVVETLTARGHTIDALNLYDEDFEARLSREERIGYEDVPQNLTPTVKPYVDRLRNAEAIVFVHPVWNYGYPAILKGYFDRIFLPGVSFLLENGQVTPNLTNIKRAAFVTTYGGDRWRTMLMGDPPRRLARRWLWATFKTPRPPQYLALYDMNNNREPELRAFLDKVRGTFNAW
jgi:NAD(P)H dehydrogenase (quinone)